MQGLSVGIELVAQTGQLARFEGKGGWFFLLHHIGGAFQLAQHCTLLGGIGMELQAEGAEAYGFKAFMHHLQRRHFFSHEKDCLTLG